MGCLTMTRIDIPDSLTAEYVSYRDTPYVQVNFAGVEVTRLTPIEVEEPGDYWDEETEQRVAADTVAAALTRMFAHFAAETP